MNFNLYNKGTELSQIWICETFDKRLRWYTGERIKKKHWTGKGGKGPIYSMLNARLDKITSIYAEIKRQLDKDNKLTASNVKYVLDCESIFQAENFIDEISKCIKIIPSCGEFLECFNKFITDSEQGGRKTKKGKKIEYNTLRKYRVARNLVKKFSEETGFELSWKNINDSFYDKLTSYCWYELNHYDNHVGTVISILREFIRWAYDEKIIGEVLYSTKWIVWKEEEVDALILYPDEIKLLYQMPLEGATEETRDLYIFGCLTLLRPGDLLSIKPSDINIVGNNWYVNIIQDKMDRPIQIRLHEIAISIIKKYSGQLPRMTHDNFAINLKTVASEFKSHLEKSKIEGIFNDWDKPFIRIRYKQGKPIKVEEDICKMLKPHSERSTGITNLLMMGMKEFEIKKISGHSKDSKAFGKYVRIAQRFIDAQSEQAWDKIFK